MYDKRDIGAHILAATSQTLSCNAAGLTTGDAVDRDGFNSALLVAQAGTTHGSPTAVSIAIGIAHSDTSTGTYVPYTDPQTKESALLTLDSYNQTKQKKVDLSGAKQWITSYRTVTFTSGTSPVVLSGVTLILGGADTLPVQ